jgi:glycosyltransferase involved in cell wall biosynthesis
MKIMTSMYTLRKGGAYDRFLMMVEALLEHRCEIHCLSLTPIPMNHPSYYNHVVAVPLGEKRGLLAKSIVLLMFPWFSLLIGWRERADLFVSFGPLYAFLNAFPKWVLRKPMVTLIRLEISLGFKRKDLLDPILLLNKGIEHIGLIFSDRIITTNKAIRKEVIRVIGRWKQIEVEVLSNNIPEIKRSTPEDILQTRKRLGIPEEAKTLVTAGVLTPRKNIEILLKTLSKLGREDLFLLIIGDSTQKGGVYYRNYIETLIKKLNLSKRVMITGWVGKEELWRLLCAADLFVLASLKEGMPNAILEALGADLPCLGSNIPGVNDILQYEELLFSPSDEEMITRRIGQTFSDNLVFDKITKLCQERKKVFVFDWKEKAFEMIARTPKRC